MVADTEEQKGRRNGDRGMDRPRAASRRPGCRRPRRGDREDVGYSSRRAQDPPLPAPRGDEEPGSDPPVLPKHGASVEDRVGTPPASPQGTQGAEPETPYTPLMRKL